MTDCELWICYPTSSFRTLFSRTLAAWTINCLERGEVVSPTDWCPAICNAKVGLGFRVGTLVWITASSRMQENSEARGNLLHIN